MSETEKTERPRIISKALQYLGALQAFAELLNIDDFEPGYIDQSGELSFSVSDTLSELVVVFSSQEEKK